MAEEMKKLMWLFGCPLLMDDVAQESWLAPGSNDLLLEVGPRYVSVSSWGNLVPHCEAHLPFTHTEVRAYTAVVSLRSCFLGLNVC